MLQSQSKCRLPVESGEDQKVRGGKNFDYYVQDTDVIIDNKNCFWQTVIPQRTLAIRVLAFDFRAISCDLD